MVHEKAVIGFIGAGGIARSHAYSLNSLRYFYNDSPHIELESVCSATRERRRAFAERYGFLKSSDIEEFITDKKINTVFILSPNKVHYEHLEAVIEMAAIKRIYIEKPVCSNLEEEIAIDRLIRKHPGIKIQVGFQYLFTPSVREALMFWQSGKLGKPLHFDLKYYHSDYLKKDYRDQRASRLTPAPDGGAMADLGSHAISLLIAFLGNKLQITNALQAGHFTDVTHDSDLFSLITLYDNVSKAVGTLSASRISSGTGDHVTFELYAEKGALRYSSGTSDYFEYFTEKSGVWSRQPVGSNYKPFSSFPSGHVPPGWLRSMIHAHYIFLTNNDPKAFIPDIEHGLSVQRLVTQTAEHLKAFRKLHY
ncbi:MAG TPA: Gfo/Idh/MocA family oxidoreductase [Bacteroidales bacterium]|nr:Gfo/Idh/MocA family oxidoreductase [Bacteroidales bacterium]